MPKITPRQRAYIRKRTKLEELDPSEAMGELNIVPFLDIVMNLVIFLLATTQAVLAVAQLDAQLPTLGRRAGRANLDEEGNTLNLSVTITRQGIIVSGEGAKLLPGCQDTQRAGRVITIAPTNGQLLWTQRESQGGESRARVGPTARALTQCVQVVKRNFPDENRVILSADPEIEFEHIVGAMDALRGPGTEPLFGEVMLSAGVR